MKAHSTIGASSAYRWMTCPGSVKLAEGIVPRSSDYALEGTAAHQLAESCLVDEHDPACFLGANMVINDHDTIVEVPVTQDMVDAVQVYVDYIRENDTFQTLIEHRFHLASLHPHLFGTADCVQFFDDTKILRVIDYKHGQGLAVEADNNPQGMYYALGALTTLGFPARVVEIVIAQPRCPHPQGPIRSWSIGVDALLDWQADLLDAVKLTEQDGAPLKAGDHCKFCPAAGIPGRCKEIEGKANALAKVEFIPLVQYDPAVLSQALHDMHAVEARIKAIREFAYTEAEAGRTPPGWKLVEKRATRKWRDESRAIAALRDACVDPFGDPKVISPAQAEKQLPKDQKKILEELTVKESSGHTLAPADDKRAAVKQSAKDDFSNAPLLN